MAETGLSRNIRKALRKQGGLWIKIGAGPFQVAGLPDIIGCYNGRFYGLEVKYPGKEDTLTGLQQYWLDQIVLVGKGTAGMVTSVEQALKLVKKTD